MSDNKNQREFIPYPAYYDDAPVDLRGVYASERPAGKHGFLRASGDRFTFEDGTPGRFWGTNFNGGACFPDHIHAENIALRLAKIGCNIVRFHQLDAEWDTPNIFAYTKGPRAGITTEFDSESMDCLDYLIYRLKLEGIYCYIDIFTYRRFKTDDGVEQAPLLGDAAKPYSCYNRRMIELQKKLAYDIWNHYNPYTDVKYKDEPAIVMGEIVNESDLFSRKLSLEPYVGEFRVLFAEWLSENGIEYDAAACDVNGNDKPLIDFKVALQEKYYIEMMEYMREIGVKIPLTGTNWSINYENVKTQLVTDYTDNHMYYYDWRWNDHLCMNKSLTEAFDFGFASLSELRVYGKPFFVSEWDMPWPNEFRAESPILFAAIGSMQDWGGFAIHTYAYSNRLDRMTMLGKETSAPTIGGVGYREGIFSTWNDPAKFGLFYHAALITRRGDISHECEKVAVDWADGDKSALRAATEKCRVASFFGQECEGQSDRLVKGGEAIVKQSDGEVLSENGELFRSWAKNYGWIDSPRTKCAYGFLAKNGAVELRGMKIDCETDFAVIAASSLTDSPLCETDNILLTTVGRAQNTGAEFEGDKMLSYGEPPILAEVIKADIELETSRENLVVWAVNAEGFYIGQVPTEYKDGKLCFSVGNSYKSIYYLIFAE